MRYLEKDGCMEAIHTIPLKTNIDVMNKYHLNSPEYFPHTGDDFDHQHHP